MFCFKKYIEFCILHLKYAPKCNRHIKSSVDKCEEILLLTNLDFNETNKTLENWYSLPFPFRVKNNFRRTPLVELLKY